MKLKASSLTKSISNNPSNTAASITIVDSSHYDSKEMKDLKETLRQRDNEIGILVNMLKKEKKKAADMTNRYDSLINRLIVLCNFKSLFLVSRQFMVGNPPLQRQTRP